MPFDAHESPGILARTPTVVRALLEGLPEPWLHAAEGGESWSAFDILGHFIHGERTDWIPRARIILARGDSVTFETFDRFAQFEASQGLTCADLLDEFAQLRAANVAELEGWRLGEDELDLPGDHPEFGAVTLRELLATWIVHDFGHIAQVARVLAKHGGDAAGPWRTYLPILADRP